MHHQLGILGQVSVDPGKQHAFGHCQVNRGW
jgi:hypothetical protein